MTRIYALYIITYVVNQYISALKLVYTLYVGSCIHFTIAFELYVVIHLVKISTPVIITFEIKRAVLKYHDIYDVLVR